MPIEVTAPSTYEHPNKCNAGRESGITGSLLIVASLFISDSGLALPTADGHSLIFAGIVLALGIAGFTFAVKGNIRWLFYLALLPTTFEIIQFANSRTVTLVQFLVLGDCGHLLQRFGFTMLLITGSFTFLPIRRPIINENQAEKTDKNIGKLGAILIITSVCVPYIHLFDEEKTLWNSDTGYLQLVCAFLALYFAFANRLKHLLWVGLLSLLIHARLTVLYIAYGGSTWSPHFSRFDSRLWPATTWWDYGFYIACCGQFILLTVGATAQANTSTSRFINKTKEILLR